MKYSLEIVQQSEGERSVTAVDAEGEITGGALKLLYGFDGARYELYISENEMVQSRRGAVSLDMRFIAGKTCRAMLSDGNMSGGFEIYTEFLNVKFACGDVRAECGFRAPGQTDVTRITVSASVLQ